MSNFQKAWHTVLLGNHDESGRPYNIRLQPPQPVEQSMDVELVLDVTGREEAAAR
jgi:hypothetical protein